MAYYMLIGVVFTLLNYRFVVAVLESEYIEMLNKILKKIGLDFLIKAVPVITAIDLVMMWPIFLIAAIEGYITYKFFERKARLRAFEDLEKLKGLFETIDRITDL